MIYQKVYFIGIKGVGMASLAILLHEAGLHVVGCDVADVFITDSELRSAKIPVNVGFEENEFKAFVGNTPVDHILTIVTAAHGGFDHPIALLSIELGIKTLSYGKALGECMSGGILDRKFVGISVAGAHGKTTISATLAYYLSKLNFDPSYVVGTSHIRALGAAGHYGKGKILVAEADEYATDLHSDRTSKFLYQFPMYLILNNIDFDHPDFFPSIAEIEKAYAQFVANVQSGGIIFANGDDNRVRSVIQSVANDVRIVTFGANQDNDYSIRDFKEKGLGSQFTINMQKMSLGVFTLSIPGYHNAKNVLPVVALLIELGMSVAQIQDVLPTFEGTKRRIERIGMSKFGAEVFDDYAHHPQEIRATLQALHEAFPTKKIVCVFQSHTYSRTKALLNEFAASFGICDHVIMLPTFASARESSEDDYGLEEALKREFHMMNKSVHFSENAHDVVEYIDQNFISDAYILVTMGAGDVYKISQQLAVRNQ